MNVLDKEKVDHEYTEAIQELQNLYNDLFYEELKEKINELLMDLQATQYSLESELKKSVGASNAYLTIIKDDLEVHITQKQSAALKDISNWMQQLNQITNTRFEQQSKILIDESKKGQEKIGVLIESLDLWKNHLIKRFVQEKEVLETSVEKLTKLVNDSTHIISSKLTSSQMVLLTQLETMKTLSMIQNEQMEDLRAKEMEQLRQKEDVTNKELEQITQRLKEINGNMEVKINSFEKRMEIRMKTNKIIISSLVGTQVSMIILGIMAYFS